MRDEELEAHNEENIFQRVWKLSEGQERSFYHEISEERGEDGIGSRAKVEALDPRGQSLKKLGKGGKMPGFRCVFKFVVLGEGVYSGWLYMYLLNLVTADCRGCMQNFLWHHCLQKF